MYINMNINTDLCYNVCEIVRYIIINIAQYCVFHLEPAVR